MRFVNRSSRFQSLSYINVIYLLFQLKLVLLGARPYLLIVIIPIIILDDDHCQLSRIVQIILLL